jgi:hypothetical protein
VDQFNDGLRLRDTGDDVEPRRVENVQPLQRCVAARLTVVIIVICMNNAECGQRNCGRQKHLLGARFHDRSFVD